MLFFSINCISQDTQGNTNVIMGNLNASGSNATGSSGSVTYSIGQVFYTSFGISDYHVAQGIQQQELVSKDNLSTADPVEQTETALFIFPNPTTDLVTISMKREDFGNDQRSYTLYDNQGRLMKQGIISQNETPIYLSHLSSSLYILQVFENNRVLKTFKILKK